LLRRRLVRFPELLFFGRFVAQGPMVTMSAKVRREETNGIHGQLADSTRK
jgi:hypothetical protein